MALIKKTETETVTSNETANDVQETSETMTETTKDVAVKPAAGAVVPAGAGSKFFIATPAMLQVVAEASWGTFEVLTASQGQIVISSSKNPIGAKIEFQAIGEKTKKVCSPNSQDPEAKEYFATCYEGEVCNDGATIEEHLQMAKDGGYNNAKIVDYTDLFVYITDCEKADADVVGEIMVIQLAPMARTAWNSFKNGLIMKAEIGQKVFGDDGSAPVIRASVRTETNARKQTYSTFKFQLA